MVHGAARIGRWHRFLWNLRAWWVNHTDGEAKFVIGHTKCPSCESWVDTRDGYQPGEEMDQAYYCTHQRGFLQGLCGMSNRPL